jgi:hypothetical protein
MAPSVTPMAATVAMRLLIRDGLVRHDVAMVSSCSTLGMFFMVPE